MLPRKITPSDIDAVFDNDEDDRILFVELKSAMGHLRPANSWDYLDYGQLRLFRHIVTVGKGKMVYALCTHRIPEPGRYINTVDDILSFSVMTWRKNGLHYSKEYDGAFWPKYVQAFYGRNLRNEQTVGKQVHDTADRGQGHQDAVLAPAPATNPPPGPSVVAD